MYRKFIPCVKYSLLFGLKYNTSLSKCSRSICLRNLAFLRRCFSGFHTNASGKGMDLLIRRSKVLHTSGRMSSSSSDIVEDILDLQSDPEFKSTLEVLPRSFRVSGMPHNILVIQPFIKWGPDKNKTTTPQLQLDEAMSLVRTLSDWKVLDTKIISLSTFDKKSFFNKGQLETLVEYVKKHESVSAVFVNIKNLRSHQHIHLEQMFKVPVFDRYNIIINIFKQHAKTKEAKLQVALAEIPFIFSKIKGVESDSPNMPSLGSLGGYLGKRLELLTSREQKIKHALQKLRKNRALLRHKRQSLRIPTIAVVGYTNAGKTSMIKALTGADKLVPEDKLFATLDVTVHEGCLPRNLKVLFVDTIGFISDIPTRLLEPFVATLEDAIQADVVLVVQDISHPEHKAQLEHVMQTLKSLNVDESLLKNLIIVGNKCDKISSEEINNFKDNHLLVSCENSTNLDTLVDTLEEAVIKATGLLKLTFRVISGSLEFSWLFKESAVYSIDVDPKDQQYCYISVLISKPNLEAFKKQFIKNKQSNTG